MWSKPLKHNKLSPVSPDVVEIYRNAEFGENSSVRVTKTGQITSKNVGISNERHINAELHLPGLQERCDTSGNPDLFKLSKMLNDHEYESKAYQGNKNEDMSHMEGNLVAKGDDSDRRSKKNVYTWNRTVQVPKKYFKRNLTDQLVNKPMAEKQILNARILDKINVNKTYGKIIPKTVATIGLRSASTGVETAAVRPIEKPSQNMNEMQSSIEKKAKRSKKPKLQTNNYSCDPSDASCYKTAETNRKSNVVRPTVKKEEVNTVIPVIPAPPVSILFKTSVGNQTNSEDFEDLPNHPGKLYDRINKIFKFADNWLIYAVFIFLLTIIYMIQTLHNDVSEYSGVERRYLSKIKSSGILFKFVYYAMRVLKVPVF